MKYVRVQNRYLQQPSDIKETMFSIKWIMIKNIFPVWSSSPLHSSTVCLLQYRDKLSERENNICANEVDRYSLRCLLFSFHIEYCDPITQKNDCGNWWITSSVLISSDIQTKLGICHHLSTSWSYSYDKVVYAIYIYVALIYVLYGW